MVKITADEFNTFLICTLRYAMGRRSYITAEVQDILASNWHRIQPAIKKLILNEITTELGRCEDWGKTLGDETDHQAWRSTLIKLRDRFYDENPES